jgi:hypothetical protein
VRQKYPRQKLLRGSSGSPRIGYPQWTNNNFGVLWLPMVSKWRGFTGASPHPDAQSECRVVPQHRSHNNLSPLSLSLPYHWSRSVISGRGRRPRPIPLGASVAGRCRAARELASAADRRHLSPMSAIGYLVLAVRAGARRQSGTRKTRWPRGPSWGRLGWTSRRTSRGGLARCPPSAEGWWLQRRPIWGARCSTSRCAYVGVPTTRSRRFGRRVLRVHVDIGRCRS